MITFEIDTREELEAIFSELHLQAYGSTASPSGECTLDELKAQIREIESDINEALGLSEADAFGEPAGAWACDEEPYGGIDAVMEVERDESFFGMCDDEMPGCGEDY